MTSVGRKMVESQSQLTERRALSQTAGRRKIGLTTGHVLSFYFISKSEFFFSVTVRRCGF